MIALAMLIAAQAGPSALASAADDASGAYIQCLFATSRAATRDRLSVGQFESRLASSCIAEEQTVVRTTAAVLVRRGERNAASSARQLAHSARQQVIDDYQRAIELEPELRKLGELCKAHPDQCRN
jgi:hypothetical protein